MRLVTLLTIALISPVAHASDWKEIEGEYAITPENYLDPGPNEPKDSHIRFLLTGKIAEDLYHAMKSQPKKPLCGDAEFSKSAGQMQCFFYREGSRYECDFSIDLRDQSVGYGMAC